MRAALSFMKVGVREFRAGLAGYIASETPVAVTRHGQTMGFFIPTPAQAEADMSALQRAAAELDQLLAEKAVDIEAVAAEVKAAREAGAARRPSDRKSA